MSIFKEILPSLLYTKKTISNLDGYVSHVVNKGMSFHYDCILHANQMNMNYGLDNDLQFQYYLNSIRAYKRPFQKWFKKEENEDIDEIMEYYNCSLEKAKEILSILTEDQIHEIKNKKGGIENGIKSRRTNRGEDS